MTYSQLYLPASIPQWEIFLGIVFVIIGYIDKKEIWTIAGWIALIVTGFTSLFFNLFGGFVPEENTTMSAINSLKAAGWLAVMGGGLAAITLLFQKTKRRSYRILAILTIIYFILVFFQFNYLTHSQNNARKALVTEKEK
jgi:uncharacterized membrane protein